MKLNAKITGSLHLLSDLAFRSVEIPLSRRLSGREVDRPKGRTKPRSHPGKSNRTSMSVQPLTLTIESN